MNITKINYIQIIVVTCIIATISCNKSTPTTYDCTGVTPTYTADIKTIMDNSCATIGCHNASNKADGKDYSTYNAVKSGATASSFMGSMQHLSGYDNMPKGSTKLSDAQLQKISCWIQNGMPE